MQTLALPYRFFVRILFVFAPPLLLPLPCPAVYMNVIGVSEFLGKLMRVGEG